MLTYLASCGDTTCDKFDSRTAKWFKIDQVGQDGNGGWVQKLISQFLSPLLMLAPRLTSMHSDWGRF